MKKHPVLSSSRTNRLGNVSKDLEEQEEIDVLYDTYYKTALFCCASEEQRKSILKNAVNEVKLLQKKINFNNEQIRNIKQRVMLISFLESYETTLKEKINRYKEIDKLDTKHIEKVILEFKRGVEELPILNMDLPKTKEEGDSMLKVLENMSEDFKILQNKDKGTISAVDFVNNLKETNVIGESLDKCKSSCQKSMNELKNLTMDEAFLKLSRNYKPKLNWDIIDLISD